MADVAELRAVLRAEIGDLQREFRKAADSVRQLERSSTRDLTRVDRQLTTLSRTASNFGRVFGVALSGAALLRGTKALVDTADAVKLLDARLRVATGGGEAFAEAHAGVLRIARETGIALTTTSEVYTRLANATKGTGIAQAELVRITETLNKAIVVSGAGASEASAALIQLSQGMASGALRGEEFNSVSEQMPILLDAIAKATGKTRGELRDFAAEGGITLEVLRKSLALLADDVDSKFGEIPDTVARSFEKLRTELSVAVGQFDVATGASDALAEAIIGIRDAVPDTTKQLVTLTNVVRENADAFQVLAGVGLTLAGIGLLRIGRVATGSVTAFAGLKLLVGEAQEAMDELRDSLGFAFDRMVGLEGGTKAAGDGLAAMSAHGLSASDALKSLQGELAPTVTSTGDAGDAAKKAADDYAKLAERLGKDLVDATRAAGEELDDLIEGLQFEAATAGLTDVQKEIAETTREIRALGLEAGLTATEIDQKLGEAIGAITERQAKLGEEIEKTAEESSRALSSLGEAFEDMIAGIAAGTQELSFDGITDALKAALADSIKEKLRFDELFEGNIFDLVGQIGKILTGQGGLADIFGGVFDAILGRKAGLDSGLLNLLGGKGSSGGILQNLATAALAKHIGSAALGTAGAGALGNAATIATFLAGGGSFVGPGTALTAAEAAILFPSGAVPASFGGAAAAGGTGAAAGGSSVAGTLGAVWPVAAIAGGVFALIEANKTLASDATAKQKAAAVFSPFGDRTARGVFEDLFFGANIGKLLGLKEASGFLPDVFGEIPTRGTQFREAVAPSLRKLFPDVNLEMDAFRKGLTGIDETFLEEIFPTLNLFSTVFAESFKTPLNTAEEMSQVTQILARSFAAAGTDATRAGGVMVKALSGAGVSGARALGLIQEAAIEGRITTETFESALLALSTVIGRPFEELRAEVGLSLLSLDELIRKLQELGGGASLAAIGVRATGASAEAVARGFPEFIGGAGDVTPGTKLVSTPGGTTAIPKKGPAFFIPNPGSLPGFQVGGVVARGGIAEVHPAERVLTEDQNRIFEQMADQLHVFRQLASALRTGGKVLVVPVAFEDEVAGRLERLEREGALRLRGTPVTIPGLKTS